MGKEPVFSDKEVLTAIKSRQNMDAVLRFMYKDYFGLLEYYVKQNGGNEEDAADMVQETFIAFVDIVQQDKFRGDSSIKSFLYSIIRNIWFTELRKRGSSDRRNSQFEKQKDVVADPVAKQLVEHENKQLIFQVFNRLGIKCKELLLLVYYEDYSMKEILDQIPGYENEQVLRNKKYKCMKQLLQMIDTDENLRINIKNALQNGQ